MAQVATVNPSEFTKGKGFVYLVLLSNGIAKVGKTGDIFSRYHTHKSTALKHGHSVSRVMFTVEHANYHANEARLINAMKAQGFHHIGEYFHDVSYECALSAMEDLGEEFHDAEDIIKIKPDSIEIAVNKRSRDGSKKTPINIRMDDLTKTMLLELAEAEGLTISAYVILLIRREHARKFGEPEIKRRRKPKE